jgi:hypothetical protein
LHYQDDRLLLNVLRQFALKDKPLAGPVKKGSSQKLAPLSGLPN